MTRWFLFNGNHVRRTGRERQAPGLPGRENNQEGRFDPLMWSALSAMRARTAFNRSDAFKKQVRVAD